MNWYVVVGGRRYGPFSDDELRRLVREGRLRPDDLVWNATMGPEWSRAGNVPGLFGAPPPAPSQRPAGTGGATPNPELMARARASLKGHWGTAVGITLVYWVLLSLASNFCGVLPLIIDGPFLLGLAMFFLCMARHSGPRFGQLFDGFSNFGTALGAYLLMVVFVMLWTLLFIIPGIIAVLRYSMTFYIIADDPTIGPLEAISKSKAMMRGRKGKLFCLYLRFIGWWLLCVLTLGIGFLWLVPYVETSIAQFYDDLSPASRRDSAAAGSGLSPLRPV